MGIFYLEICKTRIRWFWISVGGFSIRIRN